MCQYSPAFFELLQYAHLFLFTSLCSYYIEKQKVFSRLNLLPPPYILKTRFFIILSTKIGVSKSVPQKWTVYPKIFIHYKELDHTGTLSFILPIGQITFFLFFSIYFFKILLSLFFYRLIKKISSFNHFVIDKIVPNDNLNSSFIDKKVLDFFSPLKQIFFHLLSGNI